MWKLYENYDFQKLFRKEEITSPITAKDFGARKLRPKEQCDFLLTTDPLFSHRLTLTALIQIQKTAYMFQTDDNLSVKNRGKELEAHRFALFV